MEFDVEGVGSLDSDKTEGWGVPLCDILIFLRPDVDVVVDDDDANAGDCCDAPAAGDALSLSPPPLAMLPFVRCARFFDGFSDDS